MMEEQICYCFNYTATDISQDVLEHGRSTILARILSEKKAGPASAQRKIPRAADVRLMSAG